MSEKHNFGIASGVSSAVDKVRSVRMVEKPSIGDGLIRGPVHTARLSRSVM